MAQIFIREVKCDCCGKTIEDLFGGYVTKQVGSKRMLYDICMKCDFEISQLRVRWEDKVVSEFENENGRVLGEGEEYAEMY